MMMIPKTIRLNANLIALFKFANKNTILDDIYPTMSAYIQTSFIEISIEAGILRSGKGAIHASVGLRGA